MIKTKKFSLLLLSISFAILAFSGNAYSQCQAAFTWNANGNSVTFTNTSIMPNPNNYVSNWDFGDGNYGYTTHPVHNYVLPGTYYVCLTVSDSAFIGGCTSTWCDTVTVNGAVGPCVADFSFYVYPDSMNPAMLTNMVQFTDQSTGGFNYWHWSFGDGDTSNVQHPFHVYPGAGTYLVCLTVSLFQGNQVLCTDTYCDSVTVGGTNTCMAYFTYTSDTLGNVTFTDGSTFLNTPSFYWTFGDGGTSTLQNPVHQYAAGTYTVCLSISDSLNGCFDTYCETITVTNVNTPCVADFIAFADSNVITNGITYFYDLSTGNITNWLWDFGDGGTSTLQNPSHQYLAPGTYYVCLIVWTPATQCSSQFCDSVNVPLAIANQKPFGSIDNISIAPNPATDEVVAVWTEGSGNMEISILDIQGRVVFSLKTQGTHSEKINIQFLKPGLYLFNLRSETASGSKKLVITR